MLEVALVAVGGGLGALSRHWIGGWIERRMGARLPWGTLGVNLLGCVAIGFVAGWAGGPGRGLPAPLAAFLLVGLFGGFTTVSSVALQGLSLSRGRRYGGLALYLGLTLSGGLSAVVLGHWLAGAHP